MKTHIKIMHLAVTGALAAVAVAMAMPKAFGVGLLSYAECLTRNRAGCLNEGTPVDFVALKKATEDAIAKLTSDLKDAAAKALAEGTKGVTMSEATKAKVDEMLTTQTELLAEQTTILARLAEAEQKLDRRGPSGSQRPASAGRAMVDSPEFKAYAAAGDYRKGFSFPCAAIVDITSQPGSAGTLVFPDDQPGIVAPPARRMTVRDLITPGTTGSNLIRYIKETGFQNMAATVSETKAKPQSDITYEMVASAVKKIATYFKTSTEILSDIPMLRSSIDGRGRYMLAYAEEAQLLKGSGVGENLNGIYTQATAYAAPVSPAGATTKIDVLRLMMLQAFLAEYPPTGIVLNPIDWAVIELLKDTTGRYLIGNPQGVLRPTLWGLPVVATQAMTVDTALVGAFALGAQVFDREKANVAIATENEDDFINNMVTILFEERLGLAVYRPEAFIKNANLPST